MLLRRSNAGGNLAQNDFIGAMMFNPKIGGAFGYSGAGIAGIYRGSGTDALTALAFRINNNQEAGRFDENGRLGIGVTTPVEKLDVAGSIAFTGQAVANKTAYGSIDYGTPSTGPQARILSWGPNATTNGVISFCTGAGGAPTTEKMRIHSNGNIGIGTTAPTSLLSVNGTADKPGGGSWGTFSDRRVKKDIEEFKDGLSIVTKLNPVTYRYNEKSGYKDLNKKYVGFIAQDIEKLAPYMVDIIDDTKRSGLSDKRELDESALTKILVNAIKEQHEIIEMQGRQIETIQNQIKSLETRNSTK